MQDAKRTISYNLFLFGLLCPPTVEPSGYPNCTCFIEATVLMASKRVKERKANSSVVTEDHL